MIRKTALRLPDSRLLRQLASLWLLTAVAILTGSARAQALDPADLEDLVAPIALYPDDVLAIVLPASTFPLDIVRAARFLDALEDDPSLQPDDAWDDSIVALLNYPEILRMMNEDLDWTWDLGQAVLTDEAAVLDAAQAFRQRTLDAGNLHSDDKQLVETTEDGIEIKPADPEVVYIPVYEPSRVVVYHPWPAYYYYPIGYPVYYYPYPVGYSFGVSFFWGVTNYFSIGWHSHFLHVRHYTDRLHPYYLNSYYLYTPYYPRNRVNVTVTVNNYTDVWRPRPRSGDRPRTITAEGRTSSLRTPRNVTVERQANGSSRTRTTTPGSLRPTTRTTVRNDSALPNTKRSVESPATTPSRLRGIRTDQATSAPTTRQQPIARQQPATRQQPPTRTRSPDSAATRSSGSRATIASQGSQGSTRRTQTPYVRTPATSTPSRSGNERTIGAVRGSSGATPRTSSRTGSSAGSARSSTGSARSSAGNTRSSAGSASSSASSTRSSTTSTRSSAGNTRSAIGSVRQPTTASARQPSSNASPRSQGTTRARAAAPSSSAPRARQQRQR